MPPQLWPPLVMLGLMLLPIVGLPLLLVLALVLRAWKRIVLLLAALRLYRWRTARPEEEVPDLRSWRG